jgi:hypothetical protein
MFFFSQLLEKTEKNVRMMIKQVKTLESRPGLKEKIIAGRQPGPLNLLFL